MSIGSPKTFRNNNVKFEPVIDITPASVKERINKLIIQLGVSVVKISFAPGLYQSGYSYC